MDSEGGGEGMTEELQKEICEVLQGCIVLFALGANSMVKKNKTNTIHRDKARVIERKVIDLMYRLEEGKE